MEMQGFFSEEINWCNIGLKSRALLTRTENIHILSDNHD